MVATQQVNEKTKLYMHALNKYKVYLVESILHVRFINFSRLVIMWVDSTNPTQKLVH
jgi:hypothetical protein